MAVNWRRTGGMDNLLDQFNDRWPGRDRASDGSIGDFAHTQEHSGHNPDDTSADNAEWDGDPDTIPEVRAIDVDDDLREPGTTMQDVIDHMRALSGLSSVIRYMIYNRKIYRSSNGFRPEVYTGASAHTEHAHFSGAYSQASDNNTTFNFRFDQVGDPIMAEVDLTQAAADKVANAVVSKVLGSSGPNLGQDVESLETFPAKFAEILAAVQASGTPTVDVDALADAIVARLPAGSLTKQDLVDVLNTASFTA
jgi:hypothetical protein